MAVMKKWVLRYGILLTIAVVAAGAGAMLCLLKTQRRIPVTVFVTGGHTARVYVAGLASEAADSVTLRLMDRNMTVRVDSVRKEPDAWVMFVSSDEMESLLCGNTCCSGYMHGQVVTLMDALSGR